MPLLTFDGQTEIQLHNHQISAIQWMVQNEKSSASARGDDEHDPNYGVRGGIVKLEMGLGKTLLAISYAMLAPAGPTLIITCKAVMPEWQRNGFQKFFNPADPLGHGGPRVLFFDKDYMKPAAMDKITRTQIMQYDFVVVSYDTVASACKRGKYHEDNIEYFATDTSSRIMTIHPRRRDQSDDATVIGPGILFKTPWERVFADESTRFVNPSTKTYQYVMAIYGRFKYCLSGSPIVNKSTDIWAQFRFCGYQVEGRAHQPRLSAPRALLTCFF
jgi:SNF2 family DNA or RNA helicase